MRPGVAESESSLASTFSDAHLRNALTLPGTRYHGTFAPYLAYDLNGVDGPTVVFDVSEEDTFFERRPPLLSYSLHG